jgi:hypothetical protein
LACSAIWWWFTYFLAAFDVLARSRAYLFVTVVAAVDELVFLDAPDRDSEGFFAVLADYTFIGDNVVNTFSDGFFNFLFVTAAV